MIKPVRQSSQNGTAGGEVVVGDARVRMLGESRRLVRNSFCWKPLAPSLPVSPDGLLPGNARARHAHEQGPWLHWVLAWQEETGHGPLRHPWVCVLQGEGSAEAISSPRLATMMGKNLCWHALWAKARPLYFFWLAGLLKTCTHANLPQTHTCGANTTLACTLLPSNTHGTTGTHLRNATAQPTAQPSATPPHVPPRS